MKIDEPIGQAAYGPLYIRLTLGTYFILAGLAKIPLLDGFITQVKAFGIAPENVTAVYATLLPYLELFVGGALLMGLWTTLAGILGALLLLTFVLGFGIFTGEFAVFNKDLILAGSAISLLYSGPGAYSVDNVRKANAASA
jgi:uncharacterized membrane protein YphA (DoxX/SURF4 family)